MDLFWRNVAWTVIRSPRYEILECFYHHTIEENKDGYIQEKLGVMGFYDV